MNFPLKGNNRRSLLPLSFSDKKKKSTGGSLKGKKMIGWRGAGKKGEKNQGEFVWITFLLPKRLHESVQSASEQSSAVYKRHWRRWRPNASGWFSLPLFVGVLRWSDRGYTLSQDARCCFFNLNRKLVGHNYSTAAQIRFFVLIYQNKKKIGFPRFWGGETCTTAGGHAAHLLVMWLHQTWGRFKL